MTTATPILSRPVAQVRRWITPALLWRALWAIWGCDVLLLCALIYAGRVHQAALQAIGRDSAPSIIAAQAIKASLADMDADAANELLAESGSEAASMKSYNTRRQQAAAALIQAAQNIKYGGAERQPILTIQLALGKYEALFQRARDLREERNNPGAVAAYNEAAQLLDQTILPAADTLELVNLNELEMAYSRHRSSSVTARGVVAAAGVGLLVLLVVVQLFLYNRTRRIFNVPLLAASVLLFLFVANSLQTFNDAESDLKRAKEDAFTSIHILWRAWAVAYEANAQESRFLLDPSYGGAAAVSFAKKRDQVARVPPDMTYDFVAQAGNTAAFSGYLSDEFRNITFPGEREAAADALRAFGSYVAVDGAMRELETHGRRRDAVALLTGRAPGQAQGAFDLFSDAIGRTLKINQSEFDSAVTAGFATVKNFDVRAGILASIMAVLCLLGLMQRIREYN